MATKISILFYADARDALLVSEHGQARLCVACPPHGPHIFIAHEATLICRSAMFTCTAGVSSRRTCASALIEAR